MIISNPGEDIKQWELSYIAGTIPTMIHLYKIIWQCFIKLKTPMPDRYPWVFRQEI